MEFIKYMPSEFLVWLISPQDWKGFHKLFVGTLKFIPLSLFLLVADLPCAYWLQRVLSRKKSTERICSLGK